MRWSLIAGGCTAALLVSAATTAGQDRPAEKPRPNGVTIELERAPLRDVMQAIAASSGINLVVGSDVPAPLPVSVRLRNIPWPHALNAVVKSVGMILVHESGNDLWMVRNPQRLKRTIDTRVIRLQHLRSLRIQVNGQPVVILPVERAGKPLNLLDAIQDGLTRLPDGKLLGGVDFDVVTNSLILSDTAARLDAIAELIAHFDRPPADAEAVRRELDAALETIQTLQRTIERLKARLKNR